VLYFRSTRIFCIVTLVVLPVLVASARNERFEDVSEITGPSRTVQGRTSDDVIKCDRCVSQETTWTWPTHYFYLKSLKIQRPWSVLGTMASPVLSETESHSNGPLYILEIILGDDYDKLEHPDVKPECWDEEGAESEALHGYCVECERTR
jgi:hypothetical protein